MTRRLLTSKEAAEYLLYSESALEKSRLQDGMLGGKKPPIYYKIGKAVRYKPDDLDKWLSESLELGEQA